MRKASSNRSTRPPFYLVVGSSCDGPMVYPHRMNRSFPNSFPHKLVIFVLSSIVVIEQADGRAMIRFAFTSASKSADAPRTACEEHEQAVVDGHRGRS
jgi:hypothetical protein